MAHNTRTYVYATNDNITTVQNFIANSDETSPITIVAGHRYVFTKKHLFHRTLNNVIYDINEYYIEDLTVGVLKCGYLNNGSTDVPNDITWCDMGGGSNTYNNVYNITSNNYSYPFTGTLQVNPTITADTNNFLASTGDLTDRSNEVLAMLNTGYCKLGVGVFYIQNINMPNYSLLEGCGNKTIIICDSVSQDTTASYAIKMGQYCTIQNLHIKCIRPSNLSSIDNTTYSPWLSEQPTDDRKTIPNFSAILYSEITSSELPMYCKISNITIQDCKGNGIRTYNTTTGTRYHLQCVNCDFIRCDCAINNDNLSEFHRFTNVFIQTCYYGIIINGANIEYTSCTLARCHYSVIVGAGSGNHAHGLLNGVRIVHTANYAGTEVTSTNISDGILLLVENITMGEKIADCSMGYGDVRITDSEGVRFDNCGFTICNHNITGSQGAIFSNCTGARDVTVNVDSESVNVRYVNCFYRNGDIWAPNI